jgi:uncharacterized membrane protein
MKKAAETQRVPMKKVARSISDVFIEGFLVLLPALISYLLLGGLFDMLMALTQPIVDVLPASAFLDQWGERAAAAVALVAIIFLLGLATRTALGRRTGHWIEDRVLTRFPPYVVLRSFSRRMFGTEHPDELQPAFLQVSPGNRMFCFIVEELPDHHSVVIFVPLAPTPGVGHVHIADRERLTPIDASFGDAVGCLFNWGAGAADLVSAHRSSDPSDAEG